MTRWPSLVCAIAYVACTTHEATRRTVVVVTPARVTKADPALIQAATLIGLAGRRFVDHEAIKRLREHRAEAPDDELPVIDELLALFAMRDADDETCLAQTRAFAARAPEQFAYQLIHLALLENIVFQPDMKLLSPRMRPSVVALAKLAPFRAELAAFSTDLVARFPQEFFPHETLARLCVEARVAPEDEETHARECIATYDKCFDQTQNAFCETKAKALRAITERPQCHTKDIDPATFGTDSTPRPRDAFPCTRTAAPSSSNQ